MDLKEELLGIKADTVYGYVCAKLSFNYFNIIRSRFVRVSERKQKIQGLPKSLSQTRISMVSGFKVLKNGHI